ncbi:MAG: SGNH/GDSL hydrolase family protein [Bacteroidia bacterium]
MKLFFIGNSITKGEIGESYIELLKMEHPNWIINNAGINGDTLKNISYRLERQNNLITNYDYIIIEAGLNDIILPYFNNMDPLFRLALKYLLKKGRQPLDINNFKKEYERIIKYVQGKSNAKIILTTLSSINENLQSNLNAIRKRYNETIIQVANQNNCLLADVSVQFDAIIKNSNQTNYLLENFFASTYFDKKNTQKPEGSDKLSKNRKLALTIDGVHLNTRGAKIYKEIIEKLLE